MPKREIFFVPSHTSRHKKGLSISTRFCFSRGPLRINRNVFMACGYILHLVFPLWVDVKYTLHNGIIIYMCRAIRRNALLMQNSWHDLFSLLLELLEFNASLKKIIPFAHQTILPFHVFSCNQPLRL